MNKSDYNNLLDQGALLPDGAVHKDKINLLSGAHTSQFVEALWITIDADTDIIRSIYSLFSNLYGEARYDKLFDVIKQLHNTVDMEVPNDIAVLCAHPEARRYFLFEFLLDFEDIAQELFDEAAYADAVSESAQ